MTLNELKNQLKGIESLHIELPNGNAIPDHFHVTEVGKVTKHFIDCGGTVRKEEKVNLQLWYAMDLDHRLSPEKLLKIIELSEKTLQIDGHLELEVEYQGKSIEKYGLDIKGEKLLLTSKQTDCLALDHCGIPESLWKPKVKLSEMTPKGVCSPNSGCC